jgi:hypothetical protein
LDEDIYGLQRCSPSEDAQGEATRDAAYRKELLKDDLGLFFQELARLRIEDDECSCNSDVESEWGDEDNLYNFGTFSEVKAEFDASQSMQ